ncbi:ChpI protein [Candidatus Electrothrix sp.]|uniref:ChpI protein n=1 Tax=Candidatus Electrothrix sp. TaxID=2170559 RepID=UPI00405663FC
MKTAISIPDKLFCAADQYAKQHGFSRSRLYAKALATFLEQHPADHITDQLNKVYPGESSQLDQIAFDMQINTIEKEEW